MANIRTTFHLLSYAQYLFLAIAFYYCIVFVWNIVRHEPHWSSLNSLLVYTGVAISFSTLQDTSKTQNAFSLRVWQSPTKGRAFLGVMGATTAFFLVAGILGSMLAPDALLREIAVGCVVMSIGMMGQVKAASEMFEHHRLDRAHRQSP